MRKLLFLLSTSCSILICAAQRNPCNPSGILYSSLPGDTTITLHHGTQLTFNRCEYFDIRECLELEEAYDIESIRRQNLTTLDRSGNVLLSAGMFCMKFTGDCASKSCFEVPVKVRMPLPNPAATSCSKCERGTFRLYNSNDGFWSDSTKNNFRIVDSIGRSWIEFTAYCANICFNGDCKIDSKGGKTKIKVRGLHQLEKVEITTECPVGVLKYFPKNGKKKIIARLPCYESNTVKVSATGSDNAGNTVSLHERPVKELKHSWVKRNCNADKMCKRSKTGSFYKKYVIQP